MSDHTTATVDGDSYAAQDHAEDKRKPCHGCAGDGNKHVCANLPPCTPANGRTDGRPVIWVKQARQDKGGLQ